MSLESFFGTLWADITGGAKTALTDVETGAAVVNNFVGTVLGQAQSVENDITELDPALGAIVTAGISTLQAAQKDIAAALSETEADATAIGSQVTTLTAQAVQLAVQVAPYYKAVANDAAAVSHEAVAAAKAVTGIAAAATTATSAAA